MTKSTKTRKPISAIESELVTALEFIRVALRHYPKATDNILTRMDLSDEAFAEELKHIGDTIGFDFNDPNEGEDE